MKVGTRVRYNAAFLKSAGIITGNIPFMEGTIVEVSETSPDHVKVKWDHVVTKKSSATLISNLIEIGKPDYTEM
jgi:hypothetical protein